MKNRKLVVGLIAGSPLVSTLILATGAAVAAATGSVASAQAVAERAGMLTTSEGRTLYTFDKDGANRSSCYGGCAAAWPPFAARDGAKDNGRYTIVVRDDGSRQWAIDGKPLYFFAADTEPGDVRGDGQGGVWHVVKAGATASKATSSSPSYGGTHGYGGSYGSGSGSGYAY